jgi:hypothetical protein
MADQLCWICGAPASSKEHRLKKSDIQRAYGRGPYRDSDGPAHFRSGKMTLLQGPNSRTLKYDASLCHVCNTTKTQPFDNAYDKFIDWVFANAENVLKVRLIDFSEVYGSDFENHQANLYKYFAKSFGCRLVDAGCDVPNDIVALLPQPRFSTGLRITFSVNEDVLSTLSKEWAAGYIGKEGMLYYASPKEPHIHTGYVWGEFVSWLNIHYWYCVNPWPKLGSAWVADSLCIYLGRNHPLTNDERAELFKQASESPLSRLVRE